MDRFSFIIRVRGQMDLILERILMISMVLLFKRRQLICATHPAPAGNILSIVVVSTNSNVALQSTAGALIRQTHIFQACHMLPFFKFHFCVGDHLQRQDRHYGSKKMEYAYAMDQVPKYGRIC